MDISFTIEIGNDYDSFFIMVIVQKPSLRNLISFLITCKDELQTLETR